MSTTPTVYVICDANCKWESMTREQILTAITQAISTGEITDVDTGFVRTIKTINGLPLKFFVGSQSEYDELSTADKQNLFAIITNDTTREGLLTAIEDLQNAVAEEQSRVNNIINGNTTVAKSKNASFATEALKATSVIGDQLSTSVLAKAVILSDGIYDYRLSGDTYTGDDMPHDHAKYSTATVFKRGTGAVVMLWGYSNVPTFRNVYNGTSWEGWQEIITSATIGKQSVHYATYAANATSAGSATSAERAEYLYYNGYKHGRAELWNNVPLVITENTSGFVGTTYKSVSLSSELQSKKLIVSITKLTGTVISSVVYYEKVYTVNTPVFMIYKTGNDGECAIEVDGTTFKFKVDGTDLYFVATSKGYLIDAVYEEL